jgi:hypothetical protein
MDYQESYSLTKLVVQNVKKEIERLEETKKFVPDLKSRDDIDALINTLQDGRKQLQSALIFDLIGKKVKISV